MRPLRVAENILPLNEFKTHASRVLRALRDSRHPVVITQNGKPAAVLITPEDYDLLQEQAGFIRSVQRGLSESDAGQLLDSSTVTKRLESEFSPPRKK